MPTTDYLMLASGYTIDRPAYEMAKQTIKYSKLWRDFYSAWVKRESAWVDFNNDNETRNVYTYRDGVYNGLKVALIDIYGWNTFIDVLRVFEDEKGFKIQ